MNHGGLWVTPAQRASHAERELTVDILRIAAGDGRLTVAELEERLEVALTARTTGELAELTADLPGGCAAESSCPFCRAVRWSPAKVTSVYVTVDDSLALSRWTCLRSLLAKPRAYQRRPV